MRIGTPRSLHSLGHGLDVLRIGDVARVESQAGDAGVEGLERPAVLVVDVGDDRHRRAGHDPGQALGRLALVAGAAHDVGAGPGQRVDLGQRAVDVGGLGGGHRLHGDGRVATHGDVAHHDLARPASGIGHRGAVTAGAAKPIIDPTAGGPNQHVGKMVATTDGSLYVALRNAIAGQSALGVYKSSDQAGSWASANNGLYSSFPWGDLAAGPSNVVYITDFFNLYESTNGGAAWTLNGSLPIAFVGCIANTLGTSAVSPTVVYWAPCYYPWATAPINVSTNGGSSGSPASGLGPATINEIVGDPLSAAGAYARTSVNIRQAAIPGWW